jgi:hypothetical protein
VAGVSGLDRPVVAASLLTAAAVALHPALGASSWLPERDLVAAAFLLLAAAALVARALAAPAADRALAWLAALGATAVVAALGIDGVSGHHGTLTLGSGQARGHFEETGPGGRSLGLRPLGFNVGVERLLADGGALLAFAAGETAELRDERAVSHGGYRFARPRAAPTGGAARLRVAVSDGTKTTLADLVPGETAEAAGLRISVEQYFPDFALDGQQQPFTRSLEARNPAALLAVRRGAESYRAFVLQSMPGVHRIEGLGLSLSLVEVEPEENVEMAVHREPAASLAFAGALALALAVALAGARAWRSGAGAPLVDPPLVAGAALVFALVLADRGAVLAWRLAVPVRTGPLELSGAGVFLGAALVASVLGTLLLTAQHAAGRDASVRPAGRAALWAAVATASLGLLIGGIEVAAASDVTTPTALPLAGIALATAVLAAALWLSRRGAAAGRAATVAVPLAVAASLATAVLAGVFSLAAEGTYATPFSLAAASAALLGLAALEATGLVAPRRLAFLVALLLLLVRPL